MANKQIEFPTHVDLEEKVSDWAHDLRSPFNHVLGFTKMVLKEMSGPLTDQQKDDLTIVLHSSLRAVSLTNNLIEIARLQRGEKETNPTLLEIQPFLDHVISQWRKNNPNKEMPIATMLTIQSTSAELDKQPLTWTLQGFLSYLAAYADGSGSLILGVSEEADNLVYTLNHTGITKKGYDEISLEMYPYICKAYIDLQGGKIHQSELNETGAIIRFSIPK